MPPSCPNIIAIIIHPLGPDRRTKPNRANFHQSSISTCLWPGSSTVFSDLCISMFVCLKSFSGMNWPSNAASHVGILNLTYPAFLLTADLTIERTTSKRLSPPIILTGPKRSVAGTDLRYTSLHFSNVHCIVVPFADVTLTTFGVLKVSLQVPSVHAMRIPPDRRPHATSPDRFLQSPLPEW